MSVPFFGGFPAFVLDPNSDALFSFSLLFVKIFCSAPSGVNSARFTGILSQCLAKIHKRKLQNIDSKKALTLKSIPSIFPIAVESKSLKQFTFVRPC